ncbi:orotate phosphoribosyltransferase [soil metagenome]
MTLGSSEVLEILDDTSSVLRGHFRLSSGRHSDLFVQKFRALEHPRHARRFGEAIAGLFEGRFDVVASPAVGAIVLGFATALAADARAIFAERVDDAMTFRRGFAIEPGERVLVVEDVITTGGSAREVVELVTRSGGIVAGVGALLDRCDPAGPPSLGAPLRSLLQLPARSWPPETCPLCATGAPVDDPGSRRLPQAVSAEPAPGPSEVAK